MATNGATAHDQTERLRARIEALESEKRQLVALVELLRDVAGSLHYRDIVQAVARRLGNTLGLDRCSVFLAERSQGAVHLVASYEDPGLRHQPIDLAEYPEIRRALDTGQVVNIPNAGADPTLAAVQSRLATRRVRSITVVPLAWRGVPIGAIFLRTSEARPALSAADIQWTRAVADVTAQALRAAHKLERLESRLRGSREALNLDRERAALLELVRRLVTTFGAKEREAGGDLLPKAADAELDRLVDVALRVLEREATQ